MNKPLPEYDPLSTIIDAIISESRALPVLTAAWVASEALRRLSAKDRDGALMRCAERAAGAGLHNDCEGPARRRYPVSRDGELCFILTDLLSPGEAVDLVAGLRAQAAAAERHADAIEFWRRQRWPEFAAEGVQ
jgi:hypothetical protein